MDEFLKSLLQQLPNFAGLVVAVLVEYRIIMMLWADNQRLQNRINELCGDKTPDPVEQMLENKRQ